MTKRHWLKTKLQKDRLVTKKKYKKTDWLKNRISKRQTG